MVSREDRKKALEALESPLDLTGATIDTEPRQVSIVHTVRMPAALSQWVAAEAERQGVYPSAVIRQLVEDAHRRAQSGEDEIVMLRRSDLHRAVDKAVGSAAA